MKKSILLVLSFLFIGSFCLADNINSKDLLNNKKQKDMFTELKDDLEQQKQESSHRAAFESMQKIVESYYYGWTGKTCQLTNIYLLECKTVKMYYRELPRHGYLAYLRELVKMNDNILTYVECFMEGKETPIPIVDPIYTNYSEGGSCYTPIIYDYNNGKIDSSFDHIFSNIIYEYNGNASHPIIGMNGIKEIGKIDALPKKPLKTFKLEDYKQKK